MAVRLHHDLTASCGPAGPRAQDLGLGVCVGQGLLGHEGEGAGGGEMKFPAFEQQSVT